MRVQKRMEAVYKLKRNGVILLDYGIVELNQFITHWGEVMGVKHEYNRQ